MTKKSRGAAPFLDTTDWTEAQIDGLLSSAPKDHWAAIVPPCESRFDRIMLRMIVACIVIGLVEAVALIWLRGL